MNRDSQEFIRLLTQAQSSLYAYILSLVLDHAQAEDLLQETNMTLWDKADRFKPGTSFLAWGYRIAYFKVLSHRRATARDRHVFNDELLSYLAERQANRADLLDRRREALQECLKTLPGHQQDLLKARYQAGGSVKVIAAQKRCSVGVISQTLYRIRCALLECVEARVLAEGLP